MPKTPLSTPAHLNADLLPVRMCNEYVYCPRLFYLEHVQGLFVESKDTIEGRSQHERRAHRHTAKVSKSDSESQSDHNLGVEEALDPPEALRRACTLTSEAWGIRGKIDLVELDTDEVIAVEHKHGKAPNTALHAWGEHQLPYRAWPSDVIQVGLYMALLREANLPCDRGRVYYRESRTCTYIDWSSQLEACLRDVLAGARETATLSQPPPPLSDSPKCPGCSLVGLCLPMEHNFLLRESQLHEQAANDLEVKESDEGSGASSLPRIIPGNDEHAVVHVISPGATVRKSGESIVIVTRDGTKTKVLGKDIGHLGLYGPCQVTQQCMVYLLQNGVPITHHSGSGRLLGVSTSLSTRNISLRRAQFRAADDPVKTLQIARALIISKIRNQRTILRRYRRGATFAETSPDEILPDWAGGPDPDEQGNSPDLAQIVDAAIGTMAKRLHGARRATNLDALRGYEGDAAATYFGALPSILPTAWRNDFCGCGRRPPRDRVNAMLSFSYALLVRDAINAITGVGLDPMLGYLHTMIAGRPALALDLIEPFRPAWSDTCVLRLIATRGIQREDFHISGLGVFLSDSGRRALIRAYERRAKEEIKHPRFGYRMSYRRMMELECRLLGKFIAGEIEEFSPLCTR